MLDGLRFWGVYPEKVLQCPYNILLCAFVLWVLYMIFKHAIFVLRRNELERNLIKFPGLAEVRAQMGDLYFDAGYFRRARVFYLQSIDMHPGFHYARLKLADIYFGSGENEKALEQLRELLKRTSEDKYKFGVKKTLSRWNFPPEKISEFLNS